MPRRYDNAYMGSIEKMGGKGTQREGEGAGLQGFCLLAGSLDFMGAAFAFGVAPSVGTARLRLGVDGQNDPGQGS